MRVFTASLSASVLTALLASAGALPAASVAAGNAEAEPASGETVRLSGEVTGFALRALGAPDQGNEPHGLIRIELANGRSAVIDAGRRRDARMLDIDSGDVVEVVGSKRFIEQRPVIAAERIRVRQRGGAEGAAQGSAIRSVAGAPTHGRAYQDGTLLELTGADADEAAMVWVGPLIAIDREDLRQAEHIRAIGPTTSIDGRDVLAAVALVVDDQRYGRATDRAPVAVAGSVVGLRHRAEGLGDAHLLARLRTDDSGERLIDLGRHDRAATLDVALGDRLMVIGLPATFAGRDVLRVHRVHLRAPSGDESTAQAGADGVLEGRVEHVEDAGDGGRLVQVRLADGSRSLLDLSATAAEIGPGDQVAAAGTVSEREDRTVFVVDDILVVEQPEAGDS